MKNNSSWCFLYHHDKNEKWSLPVGFANELESQGISLKRKEFHNPLEFKLPNNEYIKKNKITVLLIFYSGYSDYLDKELINFKKQFPKILIINELGDEPQTRPLNYIRAALSDISLSPDYESFLYWKNKGFNCYWFTHWADSKIFYQNNYQDRKILIGTSSGKRKYTSMLKILFRNNFQNKRLRDEENTLFYNNVKIVFQYARWFEITRRIFEASACGCCVITNKLPKEKRLENIFNHNESIIFYENRLSLILEILKLILNPKKIQRIANTASYIVNQNHTVKKRVEFLINEVNKLQKKI
ncbi:hypothetical protein EU99_1841 [Prochlorococcus marinus str. MIT 9321]|uniref:Spore protein YkvP/CgeB glycosyl transferase-like domain-containing protein n=1 Tax=Prochlorococcus marinus str. MIT 9401 TaxID=167551 RepID=A0A0A2B9M3_PROMR|nr:glycosyltransferase [Prochlorococcus marinus]KGG02879.1 hypothetical protein EU99_1841 [Prochlorococcus marinus str. MIT 9321]KGG05502.1 hypothetical protein EV00_1136 [Prochlorococcus marinus str. MIT 9322]KGG10536.1 hypothetical protein EV01_0164 [Prochlorococcus marinus str. MIT 9401]